MCRPRVGAAYPLFSLWRALWCPSRLCHLRCCNISSASERSFFVKFKFQWHNNHLNRFECTGDLGVIGDLAWSLWFWKRKLTLEKTEGAIKYKISHDTRRQSVKVTGFRRPWGTSVACTFSHIRSHYVGHNRERHHCRLLPYLRLHCWVTRLSPSGLQLLHLIFKFTGDLAWSLWFWKRKLTLEKTEGAIKNE
jgi:hypothetical protein